MTFRIEEKILLNKDNKMLINSFLKKNLAKVLYEDRLVESIYFDNKYYKMYLDSEEGIVPRKKIRIRNYSNNNIKNLEIKISSVEGRFKKSEQINNELYLNYLKTGFYDNYYGLCYPVVKIIYSRSYLELFSRRITIDSNITFFDYKFNNLIKIDQSILEVKTNNDDSLDDLNFLFPFRRSRYSKYSESIKALKIKN